MTTAATHVIDWTKGLPANGWLGAHQRLTDFGRNAAGAAGPLEMGARVYLPKVGRFLQADPVDGGSLNAYDDALQDPLNNKDLDGRNVLKRIVKTVMRDRALLWLPTTSA